MSNKTYHTVNTMDKRNSIRIGLVGCVSCGKSTLLNAICVNQYEEMKKCRTTMLPSIYRETNKTIYNNKEEKKKILDKNKGNNQKIFSGEVKLTNENCKVVENIIPRINNFTDLPQNVYLDIIDIPGLNDAETKDIYYKWIEENFSELDIIIHIIDINSPFNTSDQTDILKMIIKNIKNEKVNNGRDVFLLTLVNKCDDMEQDEYGCFEMDPEDKENYDNIIKTTYEKIEEVTGETVLMKKNKFITCDFSPISAADTFVYRMLHNDPNVTMDMKLLQKFGVNEVGRRNWNRMDDEQRRDMISEHFSKVDISETLEITGYNEFTSILKKYLSKQKQSTILINRIKQELKNEELINKNISTDKEELKKLIHIYNSYCSKVWVIDKLYKTTNSSVVTDLINQHISRWINQISDLSNESEGSIQRLEEYKDIINELNTTIDNYALLNPIKVNIDTSKKKRWTDSFGIKAETAFDVCEMTIKTVLKLLFGGYSNLQNEFYLKKLEEDDTYHDFPNKIFQNIDSLRDNAYDSIEPTIDKVIIKINTIIENPSRIPGPDTPQGGYTSPMIGYYEFDEKKNTIIKFCEELMNLYNYPKDKVIDFLMNYITNRFFLQKGRMSIFEKAMDHGSPSNIVNGKEYFRSFSILLDSWLCRSMEIEKKYYNYLRNLYFINKSYMTLVHLDPSVNYLEKYNDILAIPIYFHQLVSKKSRQSVDSTSSSEEEYLTNTDDSILGEDTMDYQVP